MDGSAGVYLYYATIALFSRTKLKFRVDVFILTGVILLTFDSASLKVSATVNEEKMIGKKTVGEKNARDISTRNIYTTRTGIQQYYRGRYGTLI